MVKYKRSAGFYTIHYQPQSKFSQEQKRSFLAV